MYSFKKESSLFKSIDYLESNIVIETKNLIQKGYKAFILNEDGDFYLDHFKDFKIREKILFIIGDQSGEIINSAEIKKMNLVNISLGKKSYLASSVIRLIKILLLLS